jgi:hypothetical protein
MALLLCHICSITVEPHTPINVTIGQVGQAKSCAQNEVASAVGSRILIASFARPLIANTTERRGVGEGFLQVGHRCHQIVDRGG